MAKMTDKQIEMLRSYERDGEATDLCGFDGAFDFRNRERVIDALRKRGLLNDDGITQAGRDALGVRG